MRALGSFRTASDAKVAAEVIRLTASERDCTSELIVALEEFDRRQLFLPAGYRSLYAYCTEFLKLGEGAAYTRIEAARAAQRFPIILSKLADGSITLATIGLIARHLTPASHVRLLDQVRHKSKREVERIVAGLQPRPDARTLIRKVAHPKEPMSPPAPAATPVAGAAGTSAGGEEAPLSFENVFSAAAAALPRPVIAPLTPERFKLQITMDRETHDTLREIQDLIRHVVPSGDAAVIVARALKLLREQLLRRKAALVRRPRKPAGSAERPAPAIAEGDDMPPPSRGIPAAVRRAVWIRDEGRCAFVGAHGRCDARVQIEFHHLRPFAAGGASDRDNIELRCRAHNGYEARLFYGRAFEKEVRADELATAR
jgi:hypothetical protein